MGFIHGNPDMPLITAAVPNTVTPSPVTSANQTMACITTAGGNKIHMEDQEGSLRILLQSPTAVRGEVQELSSSIVSLCLRGGI